MKILFLSISLLCNNLIFSSENKEREIKIKEECVFVENYHSQNTIMILDPILYLPERKLKQIGPGGSTKLSLNFLLDNAKFLFWIDKIFVGKLDNKGIFTYKNTKQDAKGKILVLEENASTLTLEDNDRYKI